MRSGGEPVPGRLLFMRSGGEPVRAGSCSCGAAASQPRAPVHAERRQPVRAGSCSCGAAASQPRLVTASGVVRIGGLGVGASGWGGPDEGAWLGLGEVPAGALLEAMVGPAAGAEIAVAGPSALVMGNGVIEVGTVGGLAACRGPAGLVPGCDKFAESWWWPVGRAGPVVRASAGAGARGAAGVAGAGEVAGAGVALGDGLPGRFQRSGKHAIETVRIKSALMRPGWVCQAGGHNERDQADQACRRRLAGGAGAADTGDGDGVPCAVDDDYSPFGSGVAGREGGELASCLRGDRAEAAELPGLGDDPGESPPGDGEVQQPGAAGPTGKPSECPRAGRCQPAGSRSGDRDAWPGRIPCPVLLAGARTVRSTRLGRAIAADGTDWPIRFIRGTAVI